MTKLDDELDDFIAGRDDLSRQLSALAQPEPPGGMEDAVMAAAAARLAQEQAVRKRPAANRANWQRPVALAASVVCVCLLTLQWQRGEYQQPAPPASVSASAPASEPATTRAAPPAIVRAPAVAAEEPLATAPSPDRPSSQPKHAHAARAPAAEITSPPPAAPDTQIAQAAPPAEPAGKINVIANATNVRPSAELRGWAAAPERAPNAPPPALLANAAPPPAPPAPPAPPPAPAPAAAPVLALAPPPAPTSLPAPLNARAARSSVTVTVTGSAVLPDQKATAWLHAIDEMLKADLHRDALDEWRKFRLAYPNYPVPEDLAQRIHAIE